jgi:hypothetical protein
VKTGGDFCLSGAFGAKVYKEIGGGTDSLLGKVVFGDI